MAKRSSYTKRQQQLRKEYSRAASNYNRRIRTWIKSRHLYFEPAPTLTELTKAGRAPTKKEIEKLNKTTLANLSKRQIRLAERRFTSKYDEGKLDKIMRPKRPMIEPPTEQDFYDGYENWDREEFEGYYSEPVESEAEILADLSNLIDGVLEEALASVRSDMKELATQRAAVFRGIYESAVYKVGNKKAFLSYLEDSSTHYRIVEVVTAGIQDSMSNESTYRFSLQEFAAILNSGAPLTAEQSEMLEMYGTVNLDYTDTEFDFE